MFSLATASISALLEALGSAVSKKAIVALFEKRKREALEILIEEIKRGNQGKTIFDAAEVESLVPIVHRFFRAAEEGTARRNLRILGSVVAGQIAGKAIYPDKFLAWCDAIASLTWDELLFLGEIYRVDAAIRAGGENDETKIVIESLRTTRIALKDRYNISEDMTDALASACQRTGFVVQVPLNENIWRTNRLAFKVTPKLRELAGLIRLEAEPIWIDDEDWRRDHTQ